MPLLKSMHLCLAVFHLIVALACLLAALLIDIQFKVKVGFFRDISIVYSATNSTSNYNLYTKSNVYLEQIGPSFSPIYLSVVFTLLASLDHLYTYCDSVNYLRIVAENGVVAQRWLEYSLSAAVMNVQIAMITGIEDVMVLFSIAMLTFTTMEFGRQTEESGKNKDTAYVRTINVDKRANETECLSLNTNAKRTQHDISLNFDMPVLNVVTPPKNYKKEKALFKKICWLQVHGWLCFATVWVLIFTEFGKAYVTVGPNKIPTFVPIVVILLFILESLFAVVQIVMFRNAEKREYAYIGLSYAAKTCLTIIVSYGCLTRPRN